MLAASALSSSALKQPKGLRPSRPGLHAGWLAWDVVQRGHGGAPPGWAARLAFGRRLRSGDRSVAVSERFSPEGPIRCGELSEVDEHNGAHRFAAISFRKKSFFAEPRTAICSRHAGAVLHGQYSNNTCRCKAAFHKNNARFALLSLVFG